MADRLGVVSLVEGRELDREGEEVGELEEGGEGVIRLTLSAVDNGSPIQLTQTSVSNFFCKIGFCFYLHLLCCIR